MADGIFEADELAADQQGAEIELSATDESQRQQEQPRHEDGKFAAKQDDPPNSDLDVPVEGEPKPRGDGKVPQGALHAEREKRKGLEAELKQARETLDAIAKMREQVASRRPEPLPAADDPAAVEHLRERLQQIEQGQTQISQRIDNQAIEQAEARQLGAVMQQSETAFRQLQPDYDRAVEHVLNARANELQLYGLGPAEIQQAIIEEVMDVARSAISQGRDPAELGYQMALSRGYRPEQAADGQQQPQGGAAAKIAAIAAAQAGSKSLGHAGGGATPKTLNAETIAQMSADEFDALYSTPEGKRMIDGL